MFCFQELNNLFELLIFFLTKLFPIDQPCFFFQAKLLVPKENKCIFKLIAKNEFGMSLNSPLFTLSVTP